GRAGSKTQCAHAGLGSTGRRGAGAGIELGADPAMLPLGRVDAPEEIELAKLVERFPEIVLHAAQTREPQEVSRYLLELANAFNAYVSDGKRHRLVSED